MKKFVFSLQKVLDLKEFAEEQAKTELAEAIATADKIKLEIQKNIENRVRAASNRGAISITEIIIVENYIKRLDVEKEELLEQLAEAELVIEEKRKVMFEAMKERKVLSSLREKKYSEYKKECHRKEDSEVDDITQPRYASQEDA